MTSGGGRCVECEREPAVFQCQGCAQLFCWQHTMSHREELLREFGRVDQDFHRAEQSLREHQFTSPKEIDQLHEDLKSKIDQWEEKSIEKVRQLAEQRRIELRQFTKERWGFLKTRLEKIGDEIQSTRERNSVLETDLKRWTGRLADLQGQLLTTPKLILNDQSKSLVDGIALVDMNEADFFERGTSNAQFEDENRVVTIGSGSGLYTEVRGMKEYRTGEHLVRLKVEKLEGWILFGIINASEPLQIDSYTSPSCYGWYNGEGFTYRAGQNYDGDGHDIVEGDIAQVIIDCDRRSIRLVNERTARQWDLQVDLQACPFPWQLHLNLNLTPTRIRILPSSTV